MEISKKVRNIVFICDGGIGKNIMGTVVVRNLKKKYPNKRIIVLAGYPDVFMYNPNVYRTYNFGNPLYFFEDWVNEETIFINQEPYRHYDYINGNKHLVECWCDMISIPCDNIRPDLFFIPNEVKQAQLFIEKLKKDDPSSAKKTGDKKVLFLQWIGGKVPEKKDDSLTQTVLDSMYRRSLPKETTQELVDALKDKYIVCNVAHNNFPDIKGAHNIFYKLRETLALLQHVDGFIGIDSFLQHAFSAHQINKKGVVLWAGTSPGKLGYKMQSNLTKTECPTPFCHRPNSFLFDITPEGKPWSCQWGEPCRQYKVEEIMKAFKKISKVKIKG